MKLCILFNINSDKLKTTMLSLGYYLIIVDHKGYNLEPNNLKSYCFTSMDIFLFYLKKKKVKKTPIILSDYKTINKYKLFSTAKFIFLDINYSKDGLLDIKDINYTKLINLVKTDFTLTKNNSWKIQCLLKQSIFLKSLYALLDSIPFILHEPILVALSTALAEKDYSILINFLDINRVITDANKDLFIQFDKILYKYSSEYIPRLIEKAEHKKSNSFINSIDDKKIKLILSELKLILYKYNSFNLNKYEVLDDK